MLPVLTLLCTAVAASQYGYGYPQQYYKAAPPVIDRNVCDLDASVLLVTDSKKHGLSKAFRTRCSEVASYDEDSCNVCCKHAARRDTNMNNEQMIGFLAVTNKEHHERGDTDEEDNKEEDREEMSRAKRGSGSHHRGHYDRRLEVLETHLPVADFQPEHFYRNVKCVCCAPRREISNYAQPQLYYGPGSSSPTYNVPAQSAPTYNAPAQSAPAQSAPSYTASAQSAPSYAAPAQSASSYTASAQSAPSYTASAQSASSYTASAQSAPSYAAPAQSAPSYTVPVQSSPSYTAPAQSTSTYTAPAQSPSTYTAPAQSPSTYTAPAQSAPNYVPPQQSPAAY